MDVAYSRVMLLGSGGVGKTCLKRSLMKEPWDPPSMNSTIVSDIHHVRPVEYQWQSLGHDADDQWREVTEEDEIQEMAELLVAVHGHSDVEEFKSKMSADHLYQVDDKDKSSSSDDVSQQSVEDLERKYVNSILSKAIDRAKSIPTSSRITPQPFIHMWDCGGQPVFLEVLPAFLTSRTMFLLIYDASRSFHDRWKSVHTIRGERKEEGEVNMTTLDLMHSWLSNIYILSNEGKSIDYPRVLSIGTHGDRVKDHKAKIMNELKSTFDGMKFRALIDDFYIVDNTTAGTGDDEDANFAEIRKKICNFTSNKLVVKTPISWVLFRKVIGIYKTNVISLNEAKAIGVACKIPAEVVPKVLLFYHDLGVVLFYPHIEGLHDRVIINPKWFVNALGKVLTLEGLEEYRTRLRDELKQYNKDGILVQRLYEAAWKDVKDISPEALIELLVYFRLAAKVTTDEYHPDVKQYFLPLVLSSYDHQKPPFHMFTKSIRQRATPLHITFRTGFIPPGFFTRLVATLAESSKCKIRFEKGVYRDRIHIFYGEYLRDDVILMELPHAIQVKVFRCCPESPSLPSFTDVCQMLMKDLIEISEEVDHCLFASRGQKSMCKLLKNVQLVCSICPSGNNSHYIRHNDRKQTTDLYISCDKIRDEYRSLTLEESHWFPKVDDVSSFATFPPPVAVRQQIPPVDDIFPPTLPPVTVQQQIPPVIHDDNYNEEETNQFPEIDKEPKLNDIATQLHPLKSQWRAIGIQLAIPSYELDSIGRDPTLDDSDKLTNVCQFWKEKKTTEVSWRKIMEVIRKPPIENKDVCQQLETFLEIQPSAYMSPMETNQPMEMDPPLSTSQTTATTDGAQPVTKDQLERLKQILKDVLNENEDILHSLQQGIIDSFQPSLELLTTQQQIEEHCSKFINVLNTVGEKDAAAMLHDEWTREANKELSITLNISFKKSYCR